MDITIIEEDGVHVRTVVEDKTADGRVVRITVRVERPWYIKTGYIKTEGWNTDAYRKIPNPNPYDPDNPDRWPLDGTESPELVAAAHDNARGGYERCLAFARRRVAEKVRDVNAGHDVRALTLEVRP